ncbi:Microbial serine proteinase precursor [compost metagenome]
MNSTTLSAAIPDNTAAGVTSTMAVADNIQIEGVQLRVWATHADISELALELTSPSGTKSIVVNARNAMVGLANYQGETLLSNAFYQESSAGNWTLRVVDAKGGNAGTLTKWSLNFVGGK